MKKQEQEKPKDEQNINTTAEPQPLPEAPPKKKETAKKKEEPLVMPPNVDMGDGYRSLNEPLVGTPAAEDKISGEEQGILDRIKAKIADEEDGKKARQPKPKVRVTKTAQGEFVEMARLVLSPLLILAVGQAVGKVCAPTKEEADLFIEPLAKIISRHVPIPDSMSADLMDLISMVSVGVIWYSRVNDNLPWNQDNNKGGGRKPPPPAPTTSGPNGKHIEEPVGEEEPLTTLTIDDFIKEYPNE